MGKRGEKSSVAVLRTDSVVQTPHSQRHHRSATLDSSCDGIASDGYVASHSASTYSQSSGYDYSLTSGEAKRDAQSGQVSAAKNSSTKPRWLKSVKSWLSVSEPSAQALKHQRLSTYQRYGIELGDPDAAAKMHLPIGKVPDGVTTSTTGPNPEKVLQDRVRRNSTKHQYTQHSGSQSRSSGISSGSNPSTKDARKIAPWVE